MQIRWASLALEDLKLISFRIERERNLASANRVCRVIYNTAKFCAVFRRAARPE